MNKSSSITIGILGIIIIGVLTFGFVKGMNEGVKATSNSNQESTTTQPITEEPQTHSGDARLMAIDDYVKINISELAPVKEVLGGKYYVTSIESHGGEGTVSYEDGHNAYTADFSYTTDEHTGYTITSFKNR